MKRGTAQHPKTRRLAALLGVPVAHALGLLELLVHFTEAHALRGDVGRWDDAEIEAGCLWEGRPGALVEALVETRWLDESEAHRLLLHDAHDHATDYWLRKARAAGGFFTAAAPSVPPGRRMLCAFQAGEGGLVKLTVTQLAVEERRRQVQAAVPQRVAVLAAVLGDRNAERRLQRQLRAEAVAGPDGTEWYQPSERLLGLIEALKDSRGMGSGSFQSLSAPGSAMGSTWHGPSDQTRPDLPDQTVSATGAPAGPGGAIPPEPAARSWRAPDAGLAADQLPSFELFCERYPPHRLDRPQAAAAWRLLSPDTVRQAAILRGLAAWLGSEEWRRQSGRFVPKASVFIETERFDAAPGGGAGGAGLSRGAQRLLSGKATA